jgi:hypothetical protein
VKKDPRTKSPTAHASPPYQCREHGNSSKQGPLRGVPSLPHHRVANNAPSLALRQYYLRPETRDAPSKQSSTMAANMDNAAAVTGPAFAPTE